MAMSNCESSWYNNSTVLNLYRLGKVSIGKMAQELDISINEALDMLSEFGGKSNIRYDDYLGGFENLKGVNEQ